jgi:hypothetical protein
MSIAIPGVQFFRRIKNQEDYNLRVLWHRAHIADDDPIGKSANYTLIRSFIAFREEIERFNKAAKIVIHHDSVDVYTNDLAVYMELLDTIENSGIDVDSLSIKYRYVTPMMSYDSGVIYQVEPVHRFRMFLKTVRLDNDHTDEFLEFIKKYRMKPSGSLRNHLEFNYNSWIWCHYFIDFDDENLISLMLLRFDNIVRKVCRIEKR